MGWLEDKILRKKSQTPPTESTPTEEIVEQMVVEEQEEEEEEEETFEPEDYFAYEGNHIVSIDLDDLEDWDPIDELVGKGYQILAIDPNNAMLLKKPQPQ